MLKMVSLGRCPEEEAAKKPVRRAAEPDIGKVQPDSGTDEGSFGGNWVEFIFHLE
jgi:hypothetical protein